MATAALELIDAAPGGFTTDDAMADLARRREACRRFLADVPAIPEREPFALTAEQFRDLAALSPADRDVRLVILAHAHEHRQRRLRTGRGAPWLLSQRQEQALAAEWPSIRGPLEAEARAVFAAMAADPGADRQYTPMQRES